MRRVRTDGETKVVLVEERVATELRERPVQTPRGVVLARAAARSIEGE